MVLMLLMLVGLVQLMLSQLPLDKQTFGKIKRKLRKERTAKRKSFPSLRMRVLAKVYTDMDQHTYDGTHSHTHQP